MSHSTRHTDMEAVEAVLFDLSGTTLDEGYLRHALASVAGEMSQHWQIDSSDAEGTLMGAIRDTIRSYEDRPFHRMSDAICDAFALVFAQAGMSASRAQLRQLEKIMWRIASDHASPARGAVETLATLRHAGIRTGIVSYSDSSVFRSLMQRSGLANLTDVELCSEDAHSCKPHPSIFLQALAAIDVAPRHALFVGDSVDSDIVGGNRVGMRTALLRGRKFNASDSNIGVDAKPAYVINELSDVLSIVNADGATARSCVAFG